MPKDIELPLVTIGCLSYNTSAFVLETLKSITAQSYRNLEVIIVDDASKDESCEKIQAFVDTEMVGLQVHFIRNDINSGICKNMNAILHMANGEYITYIAADDILIKEKVDLLVDYLNRNGPDYGMVYSDVEIIDEQGNLISTDFLRYYNMHKPDTGDIYTDLLHGNFIPAMSTMIRTTTLKSIGGFDENLYYEDYDAWLRLAKVAKIGYLKTPTSQYRIRRTSMMNSNYGKILLTTAFIYKKQLAGKCYSNNQQKKLISAKIREKILQYFRLTGNANKEMLQILRSSSNNSLLGLFALSRRMNLMKYVTYKAITYKLIK